MTTKRGIVFCCTCNRIVGTSFPVSHHHSFSIYNETLEKNLGALGFMCFEDTGENREYLAEHFPPKDEVSLKL